MGCSLGINNVCYGQTNNFEKYNIIDVKYNVIIGTYYNEVRVGKINKRIEQGIRIGYNDGKINKIKFGMMIQPRENKIVELYFENDIKLIIRKENDNRCKMILSFGGTNIKKYIDPNIIKKYKMINDGSEYIDLIYNLMHHKKI